MGVGGSTSRPNSATVIMGNKRPQSSLSDRSVTRGSTGHPSSLPDHRPTNSCCSHYRENHAGVTRTVTPADPPKENSIDDEIEEIVANTLDLVSNHSASRQQTPHLRDTDRGGGRLTRQDVTSSATSSGVGQGRVLRADSTRQQQKRPSDEDGDVQFNAKEAIPEVDFAKFKKVNHQGATMQNNGRIIHHQDSDLLWRFNLISPEAYKITATTRESDDISRPTRSRSAPTNQGPYLKTPSYDLNEEQMMASIEKEFECKI